MVGEKPARVHCNTCKTQHAYKANPPSETKKRAPREGGAAAPKAAGGRTRTSKYQALLNSKDMAQARTYSIKETYAPGDVLNHPSFGVGVTTAIKDATKIEVLFENGTKVLVHGR
jgi:hypothetical protein